MRAPTSAAARVCHAVAPEWPSEAVTPSRSSSAISCAAPSSSGATVTTLTAGDCIHSGTSAGTGAIRSGGCAPAHSGEMNGPSM